MNYIWTIRIIWHHRPTSNWEIMLGFTLKKLKITFKNHSKKLGSSYSKIFQVTILAPKLAPTKMRSQAFSGVLGHSRAFSGILMRSQHKNDILSTGTAF